MEERERENFSGITSDDSELVNHDESLDITFNISRVIEQLSFVVVVVLHNSSTLSNINILSEIDFWELKE